MVFPRLVASTHEALAGTLDLVKSSLAFVIPFDYLIFLQQFEDRFTSSCQGPKLCHAEGK